MHNMYFCALLLSHCTTLPCIFYFILDDGIMDSVVVVCILISVWSVTAFSDVSGVPTGVPRAASQS